MRELVYLGRLGSGDGILAGKAAGAELALIGLGYLLYPLKAEVSERVNTYLLCDLGDGHTAGDKLIGAVDVSAEITGADKGRAGYSHMNFLCAGGTQQLYDVGAGSASYDGVIY